MSLFPVNATLKDINKTLVFEFNRPGMRIIGDVVVSEEDFELLKGRLRFELRSDFQQNSSLYGESLCMFLVYCAQRFLDEEGFWGHISEMLLPMSYDRQKQIRKQFITICRLYGFPDFEEERLHGYKIITPIICHAGISSIDLAAFFKILCDAVDEIDTSATMDVAETIYDYFEMHNTPIYIRRFLKSLENERSTYLMQWYDVIRNYYDESSTPQSLHEDLNQNYESSKAPLILDRYLYEFCEWKRRPEVKENQRQTKKLITRSPRIILDLDGLGIYALLPLQRFQLEFPTQHVTWMIRADDLVTAIECDVYAEDQDQRYTSVETEALLKPARQYRFELFIEEGQAIPTAVWSFDFSKRNFLAFTTKGDLIKSEMIGSTRATLVFNEQFDLIGDAQFTEHGKISYWHSYSIISVSSILRTTLSLIDRKTQKLIEKIDLAPIEKPEVIGGELLLNNPGLYTKLPRLRLPRNQNSWHVTLYSPAPVGRRDFDYASTQELNLDQLIESETYGSYEIRLRNSSNGRYQIRLSYLPEIKFISDTSHWPQPVDGYRTDHFKCILPENVNLELNQVSREYDSTERGERTLIFSNINKFNNISGWVRLTGKSGESKYPITITLRPILWSIVGGNLNEKVIMTGLPIRQAFKFLAMQQEQFVLFSTGDLGVESLDGRMMVRRSDGILIYQCEKLFKSWSSVKWNLADILLSPELGDSKRFQIILELDAPDQTLIHAWPILIVTNDLNIKDLKKGLVEDGLSLRWRESGDKTDRVVLLENVLEPWLDPIIRPLMDGCEEAIIRSSGIRQSYYVFDIQPTPDLSPFAKLDYKPPRYRSDRLIKLGEKDYEPSDLRAFNFLSLQYLTNTTQDKLEIPSMKISTEEEVTRLSKSILFFNVNKASFKNDSKFEQVQSKLKLLATQTTCSPGVVLYLLLQMPVSQTQFVFLQKFFNVIIIPDGSFAPSWRVSDSSKLISLNECSAFQTGLSRKENLSWLVRWIGESDLRKFLSLDEDDSLTDGIISKLELGNSDVKLDESTCWAEPDAYWGSYSDYVNFTQYVASQKNASIQISDEDLVKQYEHQNKIEGYRLFGQSYLLVLQSLKSAIARNRAQIDLFNDFFDKNINSRLQPFLKKHPMLMKKISMRSYTYDDNLLMDTAERIVKTAFAAALYRRGLWPTPDHGLMRQIVRLQSLCSEFYRRDLVLIEFYLIGGGK